MTPRTLPLLALAIACSSGNPDIADTALGTIFECDGDNDGAIDQHELEVLTGLSVPYLANAAGESASVTPQGSEADGGTTWDFTQGPDTLLAEFDVGAPQDQWFSEHFPQAQWTAPLFAHQLDLLGVFDQSDDSYRLLGLVSRQEEPESERTLVVYDEPVEVYRFPLQLGSSWSVESEFRDALIAGVPNSGEESYLFEVDAIGTLLLEGWSFDNTLRLRIEVQQSFAVSTGDNPVTSLRYVYLRECFGELARIVSLTGETEAEFGEASEFRRLAVQEL